MGSKFKCCLKPFNNLVCVRCLNVFHPSCLERKKGHILLLGYKVYCSSECEAEDSENEDKVTAYQKQLERLKVDLIQKDSYIRRQRKLSLDLESSACEIEGEYEKQKKAFHQNVSELKQKLAKMKDENMKLEEALERCSRDLEEANNKFRGVDETKKCMLTTIQTLDAENKVLSSEVLDLKTIYKDFHTLKQVSDGCTQTEVPECASEVPDCALVTNSGTATDGKSLIENHQQLDDACVRPKLPNSPGSGRISNNVLVLTDGYGKFLYDSLRREMIDSVSLRVVCWPGASFKQISRNSECYISDLSENDFVIVILNPDNLPVSLHDVTYLANRCFYVNLILCTSPTGYKISKSSKAVFNDIAMGNKELIRYVSNLKRLNTNVNVVDLSNKFRFRDFINNTFYLGFRGLLKLAKMLKDSIIGFESAAKDYCNLIHVPRIIECVPLGIGHMPSNIPDTVNKSPNPPQLGNIIEGSSFLTGTPARVTSP